MKTALIQCADTGPLESLAAMLRAVGYDVYRPHPETLVELRRAGCDTVIDPDTLVKDWGYEPPRVSVLPPDDLDAGRVDLYCDVKAHRSHDKILGRWPALAGRVLWYRINGGEPEYVVRGDEDFGDEVRPPCPVLTPNQWYGVAAAGPGPGGRWRGVPPETLVRSYSCWPPFVDFPPEPPPRGRAGDNQFNPPVCLIHNLAGWGHGALVPHMERLGVRMYGRGSPLGLVDHRLVPLMLRNALAYVHLKSSDAPGYALYEALAAGCPVVCSRRLIWRCNMGDLLEPGVTCLTFDRETHDALTDGDAARVAAEIADHLDFLRNRELNDRLGAAGRDRLRRIMWSADRPADVASLAGFLDRNFPS